MKLLVLSLMVLPGTVMLTLGQTDAAGATNALGGGAGWFGTGLLGGVLWWLLFRHLPDLMASHRRQVAQLIEAKDRQAATMHEECEAHADRLAKELRSLSDKDRQAFTDSADKDRQLLREGMDFHKRTGDQAVRLLQFLVKKARAATTDDDDEDDDARAGGR